MATERKLVTKRDILAGTYLRGVSLKILSLLSFCYFLIWTSNLSLKARCCYRRRLFLLSVFGIYVPTYVYHSICIYVLSHQHIGHGVLKEKAFRVYFKKSINCHVYLWKPLQISSCLALFFLISSHGVAAKPATWGRCKCNRSFHSRKLAGVFEKKKSSVYVNLII